MTISTILPLRQRNLWFNGIDILLRYSTTLLGLFILFKLCIVFVIFYRVICFVITKNIVCHIITQHIIPNSLAPIIVQATLGIGKSIIMCASLSFLGLGIQPPTPEWGAMLSTARTFMRNYPYQVIFPGLAIMLTVLSLNLFGDGLRDALDPKLKR